MNISRLLNFIRSELDRRNWTQAELARRMTISDAQISRVLNGTRGVTLEFIQSLAFALSLSVHTLLNEAGMIQNQAANNLLNEEVLNLLDQLSEIDRRDILSMTRNRVDYRNEQKPQHK